MSSGSVIVNTPGPVRSGVKKFAVLLMPRVGSPAILKHLEAHPKVRIVPALFSPSGWAKAADVKRDLGPEWNDLDYRVQHHSDLLAKVFGAESGDAHIGIVHHLNGPREVTQWLLADPTIGKIVVTRRNLLACYVTFLDKRAGAREAERSALAFQPQDFERNAGMWHDLYAHWLPQIAAAPGPWMQIDHTEAFAPAGARRVFDFIGLETERRLGKERVWQPVDVTARFADPGAVRAYLREKGIAPWQEEDVPAKGEPLVPPFPVSVRPVRAANQREQGGAQAARRARRNSESDTMPFHLVDLVPPWDRFLAPLPEAAAAIPSMMSEPERQILFHLAKSYYTGEGIILDAGIFLGGSTFCFGTGLQENPALASARSKWGRPIISLEMGVVRSSMLRHFIRHGVGTDLRPGDSFGHVIESHIAPVRELVDLRLGDVLQTGRIDAPIEILFLDVLKAASVSKFAVRNYFPRLIPNRSIVIQQDYFFEDLPHVKVHQEFFCSKFVYLGELGSMALFRCVESITEQDLARFETETGDVDNQIRLATLAMYRTKDRARQLMMAVSKLDLIRRLRGTAAAQDYAAVIEREFADVISADLPERAERLRDRARKQGFDMAQARSG
jgi:hypothetical protein